MQKEKMSSTVEKEEEEEETHYNIKCDGCGALPIIGPRYRCVDCVADFSFCQDCFQTKEHPSNHRLLQISPPWDQHEIRKSMATIAIEFMENEVKAQAIKEHNEAGECFQKEYNAFLQSDRPTADCHTDAALINCGTTSMKATAVLKFVTDYIQSLKDIINDEIKFESLKIHNS